MLYLRILLIGASYAVTGFLGDWLRDGANAVLDFFTISPQESTQTSKVIEGIVDLGYDRLWKDLLEGRNAVAEAVAGVCINPLALLLFPFRGVSLIATFITEGILSIKSIKNLSMVLAIVLVLKAGMHIEGCYFLRIVTNHTYSAVMTATSNGLSTQAQIEQMNLTQELESNLYSRLQECKQLPTQKECKDKAIAQTEEEAKKFNSERGESGISINFEQILKAIQTTTAVASFPGTALLTAISVTIESVFLSVIETAFLLSACIAPIFIVFAILPGESKMTQTWFGAWFSLSLLKVSYAIALAVIAQAVANQPLPNPMFLPILNGLGAPLLAVIVAAGCGIAFFSVSSEAISGAVRVLITAVTGKIK